MRRRAEENADDMIGQDSFLDVVTNIVGILILLVMVMGMRSSKAAATAVGVDEAGAAEQAIAKEQVEAAYQSAANDERELRDLVQRTLGSRDDAALREQERLWLAETVAELQQEITQRRALLSTNEQRDFDLRRELSEAQLRLEELTREQVALVAEEPEMEVIKCEPTPIASTVTGKELHIRLDDDCVSILPADELTEMMFADFEQNKWRLREEDEMIRTIGPLGGFRLQYCFVKKDFVAQSRTGLVTSGQAAEFQGFFLLPVSTPIGEPATDAMHAGSELARRLQQVDPSRTTITVWTYPGNYDRLRDLKRHLRDMGFQTSVRPLPAGKPIGFAPSGSKSVTQ